MGTPFKLKFPSVDDITARIRDLGGKCLLYKIDLQRAFSHLKLDPGDINRMGLQFEGQHYVDTSVPLGTGTDRCACKGLLTVFVVSCIVRDILLQIILMNL